MAPSHNKGTSRYPRRLRGGAVLGLILAFGLLAGCDGEDITSLPEAQQGPCAPAGTVTTIANAGFESGSLTGWNPQDMLSPYQSLGAYPGGVWSPPTEGTWTLGTGFDGGGPDTARVSQDVTIACDASVLAFDYGVQADNFGSLARQFIVKIEPPGGGPAMQTSIIYSAPPGTTSSTGGMVPGSVPVVAFRGQTVRIAFEVFIPETFTGPGLMDLDNIRTL